MLEEMMKKIAESMESDDEATKHGGAEKLMDKEAEEPKHNGGNESLSQWAKEEEAEPEHKQSTQDKSIKEWAKEEDAEPDLSIKPDGVLYLCDKPLGAPEDVIKKINDLTKAGSKANAGDNSVEVTIVSDEDLPDIPEQKDEDTEE